MAAVSPQRQTAAAVVAAFNAMDVDAIISHRATDALRYFVPATMGHKPQGNETYAGSLRRLRAIFQTFSLTINDILEDGETHRICMWLTAKADTTAGEYVNEYVWLLDFDETGTKITTSKEYSDTLMSKEFFPKLEAAMKAQRAGQTEISPAT